MQSYGSIWVHVEKFAFKWEDTSSEFKYFVEFSTDKKKKKDEYGKNNKKKNVCGQIECYGALPQIFQKEKALEHLFFETFEMMI